MFSSKFLSGANPLSAVSSAVNRFGLFGDDGEGDKIQKAPSQQAVKPSGEQQQGAGPGKGPQQQQGPQRFGEGPTMQKSQPPPKQGSPQLHGNRQAGPPNKPVGQQIGPKTETHHEDQLKGQPQKSQPKGTQQPGTQQPNLSKSSPQPESPKQLPPKTGMQQGPDKTGAHQEPAKTGVQGSTKAEQQKIGSPQRSPKTGQQKQGSPKFGQQQQGPRTTPQQQSSDKSGPQQQGSKGLSSPGLVGSSLPGGTKARSQSKAVAKSLCPVCNTTELNMHTKEPPNHKTCTQCKTEVCSLCGFSPPDSDGSEWLCLTCQIQRAQGTSDPLGPPTNKPAPSKASADQNQIPSPAAPVKKEMSASGSPQKMQSTSSKAPAKGEAAKETESQKQASPASVQKMTPETQRTLRSQKPDQTSETGHKQSIPTPAPQKESGSLFGFGAKTEGTKPEESVTGKMFGFGSSIFSSASTLITSAVHDEPKTTPPSSPKMQSTKQTKPPSAQMSEQDKTQQQPQQAKAHPVGQGKVDKTPSETPKSAAAFHSVPKAGQSTCPLCKAVLNMGSKESPNYNTCTECKSTVCNQCGFNPMPNVKEGKEWLCLNCQVKRAAEETEHQKETSSKKTTPAQPALQKTSAPRSPQRNVSTPAAQPPKTEAVKGQESHKQASSFVEQKTPQESRKTVPQKLPDQISQASQKQGSATATKQQDSGGFFGFGGPKTQADAAKPTDLVTGKMFGFGSSIFSSASTLISSAVQDEPKTTPPVSPKMPAPKDSKSPTAKKPEQEKKVDQAQQEKDSPPVQPKADKPPSHSPKQASSSSVISKAGHSTCPLCKLELNVGSKDPPNYNTCTGCKSIVCNQCGFNPVPNVKEVKEWLCLNCQMQRALGASEPPGTPIMKVQASPSKSPALANAQKKETRLLDKPQNKDILPESKIKTSAPGSPQRKPPAPAEQPTKAEVSKGPESQKHVSLASGQKAPQEGTKTGIQKPPDQTSPARSKKSNTTSATQDESGGFFGFGSPKPQPEATKPAESLGGKMFGFGPSIFSSASTLINSTVQDESKTTPPVSPKLPASKATKLPLAPKQEQEKKLEQVQQCKTSPMLQPKVEKDPSEPPKNVAASTGVFKAGQSTCPLCKVELNFGSKEPPNYNNCTECKSTVCNQCGFNPLPNMSEVKEWLCLNCQMQRALGASEPAGPPMKPDSAASKISPAAEYQKITAPIQVESIKKELPKSDVPSKMETHVPDTLQKKGSSTPGSPRKVQPIAVTQVAKVTKGTESDTQTSPTPGQKTPLDTSGVSVSQKPTDQASKPVLQQSKATPDIQQESENLFGLSGAKTGPDASKTTESMTGKMFGFSSSILSSASNLISSTVQEESRTTPPGSRKMSAPAHGSPKMSAVPKISQKTTPTVSPKMSPAREPKSLAQKPEQEKKPQESSQSKEYRAPSDLPKAATVCPLCKTELNISSKDPVNYNTCTECKTTVCNQCGFNSMTIEEVKEWLCLNCQMRRAVGASEHPGPPTVKSQTLLSKVPSPTAVQLKESPKPTTAQKGSLNPAVQKREPSEPVSPQRKQFTPSVQSGKPEVATEPLKQASPAPDYKKTQASQQESGGFFGFGGPKSQPDAAKPRETVTGKMFGFGSSIFSSASTLITSSVQDHPKTTPPVSPKMSPAKEIKSPASQKLEQQKKIEPSQQTKASPSAQTRVDKGPSELLKGAPVAVKPGQPTCPLCKVKLNMGSKDLPNYNTCTECKNIVCNQCGFNPMPSETVKKEWLCLTCQMQRALGVTQPQGVASVKPQIPANPQKKDTIGPTERENKDSSAPHSPQMKPTVTAQPTQAAAKPEDQKQASPVPSQKMPQEHQKSSDLIKTPDQTKKTEHKKSDDTAVTQQGFGRGKSQADAAKPSESVTGKMFGFGSSIFSSASTLITSAVQDQPKTTPPVSPKMSPAKEIKSPASQKKVEQKKPEQPQQTKTPPSVQGKVRKEPPKAAASQDTINPGRSTTCPLCKVQLNMGSKDPPNYSTCTECKNTVCNQCGFNPKPNVSEMKEWLCLTCQMQRALTAAESIEPLPMKPQASPSKVSASAAAQKDTTANPKKDSISTKKAEMTDKNQKDSQIPSAPQQKEETKAPSTQETTGTVSAPTKEEKTGSPPTKEVPPPSVPPTKLMTTVVLDLNKSLPAEAPPVSTDIETSFQKKKDLIPPGSPATKKVSERTQEKAEMVKKSADQLIKPFDPKAPDKESNLVERSLATSDPSAARPTNQESGGFFSFGSPKSQRAASKTTEAVTGKMLGFGSSIFSSASNLITSAVQDESHTTPPSSRKMSAPAQVSDKMSPSPKSSPPVFQKMTSATPASRKPHLDKPPDQLQQARSLESEQTKVNKVPSEPAKPEALQAAPDVGQSTCPLCKVELNMGSKDLPNYNTCTGCKATVCNKCGFNPMPSVAEVKEWLCLNCQMQRALGASEPPGLPMIKPLPSPNKDAPAITQKKETPIPAFQEDIPKSEALKNELENVAITKEMESPAICAPTKKVTPAAALLPDRTVPSTITKTDVSLASQQPSGEPPKGQPGAPQQQPSKAVTPTAKSVPPSDQEAGKSLPQKPPKGETSPAKSVPPPTTQPAKQDAGGFFGFGAPKTQPTVTKPAESVTGKMFGFGSSFLSSASNLITSAVQDESKTTPPTPRKMSITGHVSPKTTPPTPRKMSITAHVSPKTTPPILQKMSITGHVSPKTTPPASPKTLPAKDTKPPAAQKVEEKKPEKPQQEKTPSTVQAKVDQVPPVSPKEPTDTQGAPKAEQPLCPLCKVKLNKDSKDPPNYNTCTECKTTVCNQCGFNPMPNVAEVKEWLCLNCQMQRALKAPEHTGLHVMTPQPSPSNITPPVSEQKDTLTSVQKEKSTVPAAEEITPAPPHIKELQKSETQILSCIEQRQAQDLTTPKPEEKAGLAKQEPGKPPHQPSTAVTPPAKSALPPAQPAKQESGGFFGFGGSKTEAAKPAESVTGKMFGFGSSIFSSASTLISSAVQEEPKTTPPTPRKMSDAAHVNPKSTPPVSPKMPPAKLKPELPQQAKPAPAGQAKEEKAPAKPLEAAQVGSKAGLSTCPLCKVELNVGSKDPPNYNTCTECKNIVCSLCGFDPMPHTAVKEWLCLNCQTQRALLGQLGDSGKMPQPLSVSAKPEIQSTPATKKAEPKPAITKAEPTPTATKSQSTPAPIIAGPTVLSQKAKMEPTSIKIETTSTAASTLIELKATLIPTAAKVSPATEETQPFSVTTVEPTIPTMAPVQHTVATPKVEVPKTDVPKSLTVQTKEEAVKMESVTEFSKPEEFKTDLPKVKVETDVSAVFFPEAEATLPTSPVAAEDMPGVETETKIDFSSPERIIKEVHLDDHVKLTEPSQSLQQVEVQPKSQEPLPILEAETVMEADTIEVADKLAEKISGITSTPETQPVSTHIMINEQDEPKREPLKERKAFLPAGQVTLEKISFLGTDLIPKSEEQDEEQPQILPMSQELKDAQVVSGTNKNDINIESPMPVKEGRETERRRLSFQAMDESSESELTPSPSPKVQKRRLKVTNLSSSNEDIKTESADSPVEDEDFIRKQIMGMGDEEQMSFSEDEKEKNLVNEEAIKEAELDNASMAAKSLLREGSTDNEDSLARTKAIPKTSTATTQDVPETMPGMTFKKAIPVMRQRQSTDEEVESITESLSKGSSSVQASSFTPETSPTSASSLEEDSDSSPSHRKVSGDKQHRRGKHRQSTQPLPTIEDSSEEDKMRNDEKSRKDKDEFRAHSQTLSPSDDASSTEDLRQVIVMDETYRVSGFEHSASLESELEARRAVQRGRKPSPTVIPYTPSDPFTENDTVKKSLKSAEEAYEEIIQKAKAIPGESPPDIEPLYGGMAIEDYLYESLVEEPEIKMSESQNEETKQDISSESYKKLRSPEEVYEEMMQKKRELMMIEQEFQQAQTAMETSSSEALVTGSPSITETCVVAIPTEETSLTGQTDMPFTGIEMSTDLPAKKKKRPAPPRPSEPPKYPEVTVILSTPSGSIGFVRPMIPQDPALIKALFPIPDLKITQCSSGEEEDDSLADEYGVGISSDITPSDDSETKEDLSISPPLSETTEMEPICVVCEIPEPKPIPTPISAPELITTPSTISPVSPPTSPATPDSNLASNTTSSSSFQAQTPLSSDSIPLSTPTPPSSFVIQSPSEILIPSPTTVSLVPFNEASVSCPIPTTVIVTIPDVVSDPSKAQTAAVFKTSTAESPTKVPLEMSTPEPVVVQMPDLVSSPSQVPIEASAVMQVSSPSSAPVVVSAQPTALVRATPTAVFTPASAQVISASVTLTSSPGPVIVQMPDLVSTTSPISTQTPLPVSALITIPVQAQAKVAHSVPVQPAIPSMTPVVVPALAHAPQVPIPAPASTTIVKKKVPPPPPPRSTSVSLPEPDTERQLVRTVQHVTPTVTTTTAMKTTMTGQPMQSVVVDIQPRMEDIQPDSVAVPQIVTPTRQGHVVIIVPSMESPSLLGQTPQDITASLSQVSQIATHSALDIPNTGKVSLSNEVPVVPVASAPPLPPKPMAGTKVMDTVELSPATGGQHIADKPLPHPTTLPKPAIYPRPLVPTEVTTATETVAHISITTTGSSHISKPPPPIPPKPISIPAGLVFSHKPGESVKPPPPPVAPKAATLPRTKAPPSALSLSLTQPVASKQGAASPKSPLSPRHAKCLQTYVVITLPSEPGSPTESVTVQAPVRRGSIPSTKVSGVRTTPSEQKTPTEAFSTQVTVRRASVPTIRHPSPIPIPPSEAVEQMTPSEGVAAKLQSRTDSVPSIVEPPPCVADVSTVSGHDTSIQVHSVHRPIKKPYVQQQQPIIQPLPPSQTMSEVITIPPEPQVVIQPLTVQVTARPHSMPSLVQHPNIDTEVITISPDVSVEALVPRAPLPTVPLRPQPCTEVVAVPRQPEVPLDELVSRDRSATVPSTVIYPQVATQREMLQKEKVLPTDVNITEAVRIRSPIPGVSQKIPVKEQLIAVNAELPTSTHTIAEPLSVPQTVQPSECLPILREQPDYVSEVVILPTKSELPTEVITTDTAVKIPGVATVSPLPYSLPVAAEFTPTPQIAKSVPLTTDDKIISSTLIELTKSPVVMQVQQMTVQSEVPPVTYIPQVYGPITSSVMSHSTTPLDVIALQPEHETPIEIMTKDVDVRNASPLMMQLQGGAGMPAGVITTEETTSRRRTSISSVVQPTYTISEVLAYPTESEIPTQVVTTEEFASTRRGSIAMQQPLPLAQVVNLPAEKDLPTGIYGVQVPYKKGSIPSTEQQPLTLTYSSEYDQPLEIITTEAHTRRTSVPTAQDIVQGVTVAPVTIAKKSIESQAIQGPENVVSSMSHMYSSSISTSGQPPESLPSLVTQVVTTEVQRTTVSVVHERHPYVPPPSVAITIQPDIAKVQPLPKQNGKIYPEDIVDLRTMRIGIKMTKQGMDLTPPESCRQSFSNEPSGHQITAVQPEIVNLSPEIIPATTLSVVTDSITIVTCTATIASYNKTPAEKPLDIQGPVTSLPLHLTTYKPFEPLAQIVYRPVKSQSIVRAVTSPMAQDIPINLSFGALVSPGVKQPVTSVPAALSSGGPVLSLEATGAMDLSNYRPARAMVALSGTSPGVVTTIVEDDGAPVDLTAGRRSVCCDVIYKLPFTGSCRTQPPVTSQPDNRFGYRDDHYQYDNAGIYGIKGMNGIKTSMSESNLREAGLFSYDPKNDFDYLSGSSDGAIDLTAARLSAGKALDYTSKATGVYPGMTTAPYSQVPAAGFGVNSVLRTSDGIVYSSVSAQVPSTYAITTQPGSIFSTALTPTSTTVQNQSFSHPYSFIPPTDPEQIIPFDTGLPKELLPRALADIITGYPDMYSDTTLEAIAASLDVLASSPIFPGLDNTKMAQYQVEREFLELEKLKQLCLAEELEWERQEIQRYREQEQFMVQRELEELQALKQQLLLQQEEEHHAHMVAQQETYAQQKEQLQQIQQLQLQLQRQLDEHYGTSGTTGKLIDAKYAGVGDSGQYWPVKDESTTLSAGTQLEESQKLQADQDTGKKIIDSGVQTDDEDSAEKQHVGRKKKNKRNIDSSAQSDDEDQDEWDAPTKARRRSRKHSSDGKHGSKVSSIAIQTVAEISVQTDHSGTIKRPNVQMDTKVEIIKHISAPENSQRGGSLSCQTDSDRRHTIDAGYSTHLTVDAPSKSKVFYSPVSPMSPEKSLGGQRMLTADPTRFSSGPQILKAGHKSLSDPKSLSSTREERMVGYYADSYSGRGSPSGTGKKVKRTLPDPPPEDDSLIGRSGYSTNSARRRLARSTTIARAKILQDIDKELDLVERESSKLRKKQAELDEEEKEIDAKLRYLEMGINRRKEALLKEREKRERAYLQGVAEERDYMSDSEVSNIREARGDGMERPRTAPQSEFDQFIPPQTEADSQYNTLTSPYSHYAQYSPQTQTTSHYTQQNLYQQQSLYHQQVSPYTSLSLSHAQAQPSSYQHALLLQQGKQRQTTLSDLEPKITTNYEVIRNQPLLIVPTSTESGYGVAHLGGKYGSLDLRLGLEERSMASSPMSSISADSFYTDIDHHNTRNYVLIEDIGELTKASTGLSNTGLGSGFNLPDKELSKADRLLRAAEIRRTAEVADFLGSSQLQGYSKGEDDTMEEPFELKLLKQQIKQEFRRGTEGLEHLTGLGLPHYLPSDSSFRHFPKGEKYSISRLTLEKQAAKQLPAAVLYQKQMKNKKALIDPKAITKFSPIQESRDLEPDFGSYMGSGASSVTNLAARARLLQDEITFGLRKNLSEQQKYLGSSLGANLAGSLNLGQSLGLASTIRATAQDDGTYPSGTRSRPSSRPSSRPASVYGLDLSIKRDLSSSSLRLKTEGEALDATFAPGVTRAKPTSLPISQSRGRIPIVAQNSEEESPLSPVGQPMGMSRASAGPLPPISADSRDQFGSSHSLPEVQQHMREESRTHGYDRDIAFIMDDLQGAMSDSEAYHLRREDTDWFDKPREGQLQGGSDRRQTKLVPYAFPHTRIKLKRDLTDTSVSGNGLGIRVVGGKEIPGSRGEIGAYIAKVIPGGVAEQAGRVAEGMQVMEWNRVPLTGKTYEEVQCIMGQPCAEAELCVRLDLNMLSDPDHPQALEHHVQLKAGGQRSPGVDPKQLAAELQKVSQQQAPGVAGTGVGPGSLEVLSALERSALLHSGTGSAASSGVPSPGQPASPAINKKQRHKPTEGMKMPHPITGEIQLQINYDRNLGNLIVHVLQARNLAPRDNDGYSDPFVKVYLLPGRSQVMVVQNASADNKRRTKYAQKTTNPEWNQTVIYKNIHLEQLKKKTLEVTVWDYDRSSSNDFLGEVLIDLSNTAQLDNTPRWLPLKEQSESIEHSRAHHTAQGPPGSGSGQGHGQGQGHMFGPGMGPGHGMGQGQAPGQGDGSHDSPKNSVIKSRSHGIFPDPAKDMQMMPLEKSHSSPGSSKSSSDGQLRSHGPSRSQSKSSVTQAHLEDAGIAIAAAEAAVQQSRLQPRPGHRLGDVSGSVVLSAPSLVGDAYGGLDGEDGAGTGVDSAIFQVPRIGKAVPNGSDKNQLGTPENEGGKTQVMGEIKVALKKEMKTEGDQLVLEILQCRNITYKFKSPDHLPDLYVKLYVVNVATQKRIIKKKTRVCRHDREPSFNETFRFPLNPTGHSIQLFLVSNGGKFMKKTLIGEAYIWLDKVDMRKRVVSWHKLFVSSTQTNP